MSSVIKSIDRGSPASRSILRPGDELLSINGNRIIDVLDYKYYSYDPVLRINAKTPEGKFKVLMVKKAEGEDLGIDFENYLMDKMHHCANNCIFCFVDQMPEGMRDTLYFKDDDARMSFLMGNYITLTNLTDREVERIIQLKISPINISVHSTDPALRSMMLGHRNGGRGIEIMRRFAENDIIMNCQIVCCPGINDGENLLKTMTDLEEMHRGVKSVAIVPVGLTKFRQGLYELKPFTRDEARETIKMVEDFSQKCLEKHGSRIFFCSDELYIKAEYELPPDEFYEDYPQFENGVGMMRLLITEFESALKMAKSASSEPFCIATGVAAAPFLQSLYDTAKEKFPSLDGKVYTIRNEFFGETINVAGLITAGDIINQLKDENVPGRMLIPQNMLRHGEGVFLDDLTPEDVGKALGTKVIPVMQDGFELCKIMLDTDI